MPEPAIERQEFRRVTLQNHAGCAEFQNGVLQWIDVYWRNDDPLSTQKVRLPYPTLDQLTEWIEYLRFIRAEMRRIRDGAQEADDASSND